MTELLRSLQDLFRRYPLPWRLRAFTYYDVNDRAVSLDLCADIFAEHGYDIVSLVEQCVEYGAPADVRAEVDEEIAEVEKSADAQEAEMQQDIDDLEAEVRRLESEVRDLERRVEDLEDERDTLKGRVSDLQSTVEGLQYTLELERDPPSYNGCPSCGSDD